VLKLRRRYWGSGIQTLSPPPQPALTYYYLGRLEEAMGLQEEVLETQEGDTGGAASRHHWSLRKLGIYLC